MTELEKWMCDDITFCGSECDNTECFRHRANMLTKGPHSIADFRNTEVCPMNSIKAEWIKQDDTYVCSNCGKVAPYYIEDNIVMYWKELKYCPYCGAKMNEVEE